MAFTAWEGDAFFYKNARSVFQCDDAERLRPRFRSGSLRCSNSVIGVSGTASSGRATSGRGTCGRRGARCWLAAGHCPKVAMRSSSGAACSCGWARRTASSASCLKTPRRCRRIWSDLGGSTAARGWPAPPTRSSCTCSGRSARCRSSGSRSWPVPASCAVRPASSTTWCW